MYQLPLQMNMDDFLDPFFEGNDTKTLVDRYERMMEQGQSFFFDVEEFEDILDYYMEERNSTKAFEVLSLARTQHPGTHELSIREAELLATVGRGDEALELLAGVELFEKFNTDLFLTKASIFSQLGEIQKAIDTLKYTLEISDDNDKDEILLSLAFEYQSLVDYKSAIRYLQMALERNPENDDALYELAFCLDQSERDIDAVDFFLQHIDENPYSHHAWFNLGNAYSKLDMNEKAVEAYDYAIVIKEDFASAYFSMALAYIRAENYDQAIVVLHESLEYELIDSVTYYYIGECFEKLHDYRNAEKYYKKAVDSDPNMANAWLGLAVIADEDGRLFESLSLAKKAISIDKENAESWLALAVLQGKAGFIDEAIESYEKVIAFNYDKHDVYLNYSEILFDNDLIDEANDVIETGLEKHPDQSEIYYRFAAYLLKNGQEQDALDYLAQGLELDTDNLHELISYYPEALSFESVLDLIEKHK